MKCSVFFATSRALLVLFGIGIFFWFVLDPNHAAYSLSQALNSFLAGIFGVLASGNGSVGQAVVLVAIIIAGLIRFARGPRN
jgi:hypothetical protein